MFGDLWAPTSSINWEYSISVVSARTRERLPDEIIPLNAELSRTLSDNGEKYNASRAIDLDRATWSYTGPGSDGTVWLKVILDKTHCVRQVQWHNRHGKLELTWTCSTDDCSTCEGNDCSDYSLTVSSERTSTDGLPLQWDCQHGDTVKLQRNSGSEFSAAELAVIGKQGENIRHW